MSGQGEQRGAGESLAGPTDAGRAVGEPGATGQPAASSRLAARPRLLIGTLVYTGMTVSMIGTLGAPMIPLMVEEYHVSFVAAQWMLTVSLLVGAVAGPTLGRLGDGPRRKGVLMGGLAFVAAGAVIAATGVNFAQVLVGRGLMGVGLGVMPLTFAAARDALPSARAVAVVAVLSVTVAAGTGLGYPTTGLIADRVDYRHAFWLAAVLTGIAIVLIAVAVPRGERVRQRQPFDVAGAALLGLSLGSVLLGFSQGPRWGWGSAAVLALFATAVALAAGWFAVERVSRAPLVNLRCLAPLPVMVSNGTALLMGFGLFGTVSLVLRLVQTPDGAGYGFGGGVTMAGLVIAPMSVGTLLATPVARAVGERFGPAVTLLLGTLVAAGASFLAAARHHHLVEMGTTTALLGVGIGAAFAAMPTLIITHVPPAETGSATSFNQAIRVVGGSMGSAMAASLLAGYTPAGAVLPRESGYTAAFVMLGAASLLACLPAIALRRSPPRRQPAGQRVPAGQAVPAPRALALADGATPGSPRGTGGTGQR